ncbi:hypothetical protein [Paenibacillus sp. GCM10027626]|uniref:hypothetical protein n=1 Tax=Paenibacillus sp. GCM10027626 TaxID=3273411 RepID=UPI003637F00E
MSPFTVSVGRLSREMCMSELHELIMLEETLGYLEYVAQRQWFTVITGDAVQVKRRRFDGSPKCWIR